MSRWHSRHAQTPQLCLCVQLNQQLHSYSWQDSLTYTKDSADAWLSLHSSNEGSNPKFRTCGHILTNCFTNTSRCRCTSRNFSYKKWFNCLFLPFFFFFLRKISALMHVCLCDPLHVGCSCWWELLQQCWWLLPSAGCPSCLTPARPCRWSKGSFLWLVVCLRYSRVSWMIIIIWVT